jgi:uncharacterized protein (DUF488 family)
MAAVSPSLTIWTVGHSTRSIAELVDALAPYGIEAVADVRRFPGSRRLPQFTAPALRDELERAGLSYLWIPALGGRRRASSDSVNTAWRNESFRAYADHVRSEEFADGLFELLMVARGMRTTIMCAEVLWWRCHRRLIAELLHARGERVIHLLAPGKSQEHRPFAEAESRDGRLYLCGELVA